MRRTFLVLTSTLFGLGGFASTGQAQVTAEDGLAVVRPKATLTDGGTLKVRLTCLESPTGVPCAGEFRLALDGADWAFAEKAFSAIPSGETKVVTVRASLRARKHMRKRCSATTRAVVARPLVDGQIFSAPDVDQRAVKVSRKSAAC